MKKIILALLVLFLLVLLSFVFERSQSKLEKYASRVITKCRFEEHKSECYEREIPKAAKSLGMDEAFELTSLVQEKDPNFYYCHVLGHNIASRETAKDPSKWKEVVANCPSGICSNGCIHGAFQEKFREESVSEEKLPEVEKEITNICEKSESFNPSDLEQASCYHALGHLVMYITSGNTQKSIEVCGRISIKHDGRDFRGVCFDGVFMQMFQPLDAEDEALVYGKVPKKDEVFSYCSKFSKEQNNSCWNESWPLFLEEIVTPSGLKNFCSKGEIVFDQCLLDTLYILPIIFQFNEGEMQGFCDNLLGYEVVCYSNFSNRILEIDYKNKQKAVNFCDRMSNVDGKKACTQRLIEYARFVFKEDGTDFKEFCSLVSEESKPSCKIQ